MKVIHEKLEKQHIKKHAKRLAFLGLSLAFLMVGQTPAPQYVVTLESSVHRYPFLVELAKTPKEQAKGLMFRNFLREGTGMLFVYNQPQSVSFWMKNTRIPLDMLFFDEDQGLQYIVDSAPPCQTYQPCLPYTPPMPIQYILEVNAGFNKQVSLKLGDRLDLSQLP